MTVYDWERALYPDHPPWPHVDYNTALTPLQVIYRWFGILLISSPFIQIVIQILPGTYVFETKFINMDNLSIGNLQGLEKIRVTFAIAGSSSLSMNNNLNNFSRI